MSEDSFRMLMWLLLIQERQWRARYEDERCANEWFDYGGEA